MSGLKTVTTTILTERIQRYFRLGTSQYGIVYSGINEFYDMVEQIDFANRLYSISTSTDWYYLYCFVIMGLVSYGLLKLWKNFSNQEKTEDLCVLAIYHANETQIIIKYILKYPECFGKVSNLHCGSKRNEVVTSKLKSECKTDYNNSNTFFNHNTKITVNDIYFGMKGYILCKRYTYNIKIQDTDCDADQMYIELHLDVSNINKATDYITNMSKRMVEDRAIISLYHVKTFTEKSEGKNSISKIYSGPKLDTDNLKERFIDTFFHHEKERLWNMAKVVHFHREKMEKYGQSPQMGLLLHGPPGTGKSSFAYRIARTLNRHIVSLDIREFINNKRDLFQILKSPHIWDSTYIPSNVVFILDEFDLVVEELIYNKKLNDNKIQAFSKIVNDIISIDSEDLKEDEETKVNSIANSKFRLEDLLELLCGPVPNIGAIIIATTNNFEKIRKACPALVRPGRLTPVEFNHFHRETLQEMVHYYFDKRLEIDLPEVIDRPNSEIVELALNSTIMFDTKEEQFNNFQAELLKLI